LVVARLVLLVLQVVQEEVLDQTTQAEEREQLGRVTMVVTAVIQQRAIQRVVAVALVVLEEMDLEALHQETAAQEQAHQFLVLQ
jgi:hypothetical protein